VTQPAIDSNPPSHPGAELSGVPAHDPEPLHPLHHRQEGVLPAIQSLLSIMVTAIFIITFVIQPFRIPSGSMEPTLLVGDFLLVNKQISTPGASGWIFPTPRIHRGEVIVFHYPVNPTMHLVKRVVGLPGDRIKLHDGRVYVDDQPLTEPYAVYRPSAPDGYRDNFPRLQSTEPDVDSRWWIRMHTLIHDGELTIPPGNYFVLGDNRNDSEDSRYWGFVPRDAIVGEPLLIYFSLQQPEASDDEIAAAHPSNAIVLHRRRSSALDAVADFARWGRTLQIVR
jgi:signal peptidase I